MSKYLLFVLVVFLSVPAFAQCTSPNGAESQTRYSGNKLYYCGGGTWREVPGSSGGGTGAGCVVGSVYVPGGYTHTFFSADTHANCASIGQARTCMNGVLSGSGAFSHIFCNPPTSPTCGGVEIGGYCWYLSSSNFNCDTVCTGHGGCNLIGTRDYAGSGGTDANCWEVLDALGVEAGTTTSGVFNYGCYHYAGIGIRRRRSTAQATTCGGSVVSPNRRVCACNE